MSVESKSKKKKFYRKLEAERVRAERVICGYVKYRHPDIYSEGEEYYNWLNQIYPAKKDLRKSNEFESLKDGRNISIKKYYIRKKTTKQHIVEDSMVLNIPLMDETDIDAAQTPTANETTQETVEEVVLESSSQPQPANETIQETTEEVVLQSSLAELPLSDDMMDQIIKGLREDPDICGFFDNIEFELDNCPLW